MRSITTIYPIALLFIYLFDTGTVVAASKTVEQRLAESVIRNVPENVPQWLSSEKDKFLTLFDSDMTGNPRGGAILLPPLGAHPDWPGVMHHLRTTLPRYGWSTLSIQMPVLDDDSTLNDYLKIEPSTSKRINAAIAFMHSKGYRNIAIIGKGVGAAAGAAYLAKGTDANKVHAFIGISMSGHSEVGGWLYSPNSISKLALPILDIYGSHDHYHVLNSADARADAARQASLTASGNFNNSVFQRSATAESAQTRRSGYIAFRRMKIIGANVHFSGAEEKLTKRVIGWLKQHAGGIAVN